MDNAMKTPVNVIFLTLMLLVSTSSIAFTSEVTSEDPGWPRLVQADGKELIIYQPQVDYWTDYKILHFRCAISVKTGKSAKEKFGVMEIEAETVVDQVNRVVTLIPSLRTLRFPNTSDSEENTLRQTVDELYPKGRALTVSLDRIIAYLDPKKQPQQHAVELNLDPPKIFFSSKPAILVMFIGEPQLQPVVKDHSELMFAVNTNWPIFFDTADQRYYLLNGDNWLMTVNAQKGPWTPAGSLPKILSSLPDDENWADVRAQMPGKRASAPPAVFISTEPAELILTQGEPTFSPIRGTKLMRVANTETSVFLHSGEKKYYLLAAGRWFRAAGLTGPWSTASNNLPKDFARIPDDDPAAFVKASVPGTVEAKDAVLLASIPTKTITTMTDPPVVQVSYDGEPKFQTIESTTIQYAINSPNSVFLVDGSYYCCNDGVWFVSRVATGPWMLCTSVPSVIYTIPPSHPTHNVTYVVVQSSTPTTVVYTQTAGYSGEYVAATGVLMFGAGMIAGAIINDSHNNYYYPRYPVPYSYGWGARYDYHHGGYYRAGHVAYGPYAGAGAGAAYNPRTGTYSRGAYAYGPAGSAAAGRAYNPYTGTRASAARVDTAYGSAGRAAAYNPYTGNAARGGYRTGEHGSAAAVQTNRGTGAVGVRGESGAGAAAWDTRYGQGAVAKDRQGNVYAGKDGNVYKKNNSGNWSSNTGSSSRPAPTRELNSQAGARSRGNQMYGGGGGRSGGGGGGGGRGGGGRR
jgi:uncharacterized membrane protein YgcG